MFSRIFSYRIDELYYKDVISERTQKMVYRILRLIDTPIWFILRFFGATDTPMKTVKRKGLFKALREEKFRQLWFKKMVYTKQTLKIVLGFVFLLAVIFVPCVIFFNVNIMVAILLSVMFVVWFTFMRLTNNMDGYVKILKNDEMNDFLDYKIQDVIFKKYGIKFINDFATFELSSEPGKVIVFGAVKKPADAYGDQDLRVSEGKLMVCDVDELEHLNPDIFHEQERKWFSYTVQHRSLISLLHSYRNGGSFKDLEDETKDLKKQVKQLKLKRFPKELYALVFIFETEHIISMFECDIPILLTSELIRANVEENKWKKIATDYRDFPIEWIQEIV